MRTKHCFTINWEYVFKGIVVLWLFGNSYYLYDTVDRQAEINMKLDYQQHYLERLDETLFHIQQEGK